MYYFVRAWPPTLCCAEAQMAPAVPFLCLPVRPASTLLLNKQKPKAPAWSANIIMKCLFTRCHQSQCNKDTAHCYELSYFLILVILVQQSPLTPQLMVKIVSTGVVAVLILHGLVVYLCLCSFIKCTVSKHISPKGAKAVRWTVP